MLYIANVNKYYDITTTTACLVDGKRYVTTDDSPIDQQQQYRILQTPTTLASIAEQQQYQLQNSPYNNSSSGKGSSISSNNLGNSSTFKGTQGNVVLYPSHIFFLYCF